jgi:hypothetical protein
MAWFGKKKPDVVVVAVRMGGNGKIEWLRGFERRGPTWSDYVKITRASAIDRIRAGERFVTGERITYQAGTFNTFDPIQVEERAGEAWLVAGAETGQGDTLARTPVL